MLIVTGIAPVIVATGAGIGQCLTQIAKSFGEKLNNRLKHIGRATELDYDLYAYVFRHTAITVAIDGGLPVSYISNAAGTSVEMIWQHIITESAGRTETDLRKRL